MSATDNELARLRALEIGLDQLGIGAGSNVMRLGEIKRLITLRAEQRENREALIDRLCSLTDKVLDHFGARHASDCLCGKGGCWRGGIWPMTHWRNSGETIDFIEGATLDAIAGQQATDRRDKQQRADLLLDAMVGETSAGVTGAEHVAEWLRGQGYTVEKQP